MSHFRILLFIRLEARLRPDIGFTVRGELAVFTRSVADSAESEPIWSTWLAAGPNRFWVRSEQLRQLDRRATLFTSVRPIIIAAAFKMHAINGPLCDKAVRTIACRTIYRP